MVERLPLPAVLESPRVARRFVREQADRWGYHGVISEAELLTSEVVTNAVLHAGDLVEVEIADLDDRLLVVVVDPERDREPHVQEPGPADASGRGLAIVDAIARDWGVAPLPDDGKAVWFTLSR